MRRTATTLIALAAIFIGAAAQDRITVDPAKVINHVSPLLYGSGMEDVNHEVYGGIYNQRIYGESFEEGADIIRVTGFTRYDAMWKGVDDYVYSLFTNKSAKLIMDQPETGTGKVGVDIRFESIRPGTAGLFLHVSNPKEGPERLSGYEFGISAV
ncbi:MAG: alpha-L-arabinofuranosidase, partial [Bacteroidales bacterium]|nr:alpha-L-arabinofuranosidase [Bacteroidales bacterium]